VALQWAVCGAASKPSPAATVEGRFCVCVGDTSRKETMTTPFKPKRRSSDSEARDAGTTRQASVDLGGMLAGTTTTARDTKAGVARGHLGSPNVLFRPDALGHKSAKKSRKRRRAQGAASCPTARKDEHELADDGLGGDLAVGTTGESHDATTVVDVAKRETNNKKNKKKRKREQQGDGEGTGAVTATTVVRLVPTPAVPAPATAGANNPPKKPNAMSTSATKTSSSVEGATARSGTRPVEPLSHPFPTDPGDHCETPLQAYKDVEPVLVALAKALGKTKATLRILDPFYCDGAARRHLHELGFTSARNDNADWYELLRTGTVPDHDVLLTNPPYSGGHLRRILVHVAKSNKPALLLLPRCECCSCAATLLQKALVHQPRAPRNSADTVTLPRAHKARGWFCTNHFTRLLLSNAAAVFEPLYWPNMHIAVATRSQ
jgi:hypothetical protein